MKYPDKSVDMDPWYLRELILMRLMTARPLMDQTRLPLIFTIGKWLPEKNALWDGLLQAYPYLS